MGVGGKFRVLEMENSRFAATRIPQKMVLRPTVHGMFLQILHYGRQCFPVFGLVAAVYRHAPGALTYSQACRMAHQNASSVP